MKIKFWMCLLNIFILFKINASILSPSESPYGEDEGTYLGIMSGLVNFDANSRHFNLHLKTGYYIGGYFGYKFPLNFKIEGELSVLESKVDHYEQKTHGSWKSLSYMVNTIYEFPVNFLFKPYLGFGMGYADTNAKWKSKCFQEEAGTFGFTGNEYNYIHHSFKISGFAWQPIVGVNYILTPKFKVSVDYRFTGINNYFKYHKIGLSLTRIF